MTEIEHDPDGDYEAVFNDGDYIRHNDVTKLLERVEETYEMRDHLNGDGPTSVTIGPAGNVDVPQTEWPEVSD